MKPTRPSSPGGGSAGDPSRLNRVAARRSSLRFSRNTPGPVLPVGGSSLTRLVSRAPRRPRRSRGFHHRLFTASLRAAHRCVSVGIHPGQFSRWGLLPHAPCQPGPHRENWPHRENRASPPPGELASIAAAGRETRTAAFREARVAKQNTPPPAWNSHPPAPPERGVQRLQRGVPPATAWSPRQPTSASPNTSSVSFICNLRSAQIAPQGRFPPKTPRIRSRKRA